MSFLSMGPGVNELNKEDVGQFNAFDSNKKSSSVTLTKNGKSVTYIKGAPERIIEKCTHFMDLDGKTKELKEKNYLTSYLDEQA